VPGISWVSGIENPGLTKEKAAPKQAFGTINILDFPGYVYMQNAPQAFT